MKHTRFSFLPLIAIVVLWVAFCFPYFGKGLIPFPSKFLVTFFPPWNTAYGMPVKNNAMPDVISQIYPWKKITIESLKLGQIPLWNPYSFAGTAHAANYQSAVFSPFNALFFLFSFIDAWSVFVLLQPLLAGIGMYLFIRSLGRSKNAATLSSMSFMFCGFMTTWMAYGTLGYAALCLPYALWAVTSYMKKNKWWYLVVLAGSIVCSFVSGHFQISLYVTGAVATYILFVTLSTRKFKQGLLLGLVSTLGVLIAMPQILLTLQAYMSSTRSSSFIKGEVIPWKYIVTIFSPDFYGNPVTRNDWFGHYAEWASYIGVIPLILAVFAMTRSMKGYVRFFSVLAIFSIFLAYPTPLNDLLFALKLPVVSTSAASRIIILFSLSMSALAGFGMDELIDAWKTKKRTSYLLFASSLVLVIAIVWFLILVIQPFTNDGNIIAKRNLLLPTALFGVSLALMASGFIKKMKWYILPIVALLLFTMFDMYRYASKWMPFDEKEFVYPEMNVLKHVEREIGSYRVFGNIGGETGMTSRIPLIEGYDAMYQGRYAEFINASSNGIVASGDRSVVMFDKYGRYKDQALQILGVRYILHRVSDGRNVWAFPVWQYEHGEMKKTYEDGQYEVYVYEKSFPRAFLASSFEVISDNQKIIDRLFAPDFDRRNTLLLETEPMMKPQTGEGEAQIVFYSPNVVTIKTSSDVPKLLFLSDVFDAGWNATIDGKKTTVFRADYDFRAVAVPAGMHTIEYRYHPVGFRIGLVVSALSIISLFGIAVWTKKQKN